MAHYEKFFKTEDMTDLHTAIHYWDRRIALPDSALDYYEQRWFAMLKAGESKERFFKDFSAAAK